MNIIITLDTSDESMVGGDSWGVYNPTSSVNQFMSAARLTLAKYYPDESITILSGHERTIRFEPDFMVWQESDVHTRFISDTLDRLYLSFTWLVRA